MMGGKNLFLKTLPHGFFDSSLLLTTSPFFPPFHLQTFCSKLLGPCCRQTKRLLFTSLASVVSRRLSSAGAQCALFQDAPPSLPTNTRSASSSLLLSAPSFD